MLSAWFSRGATAGVLSSEGSCQKVPGQPLDTKCMQNALFADVASDDMVHLLQVKADVIKGHKPAAKGAIVKRRGRAAKSEAAALQLAADALAVAGASAELLTDAGKTVAEMASPLGEEAPVTQESSAESSFASVLQKVQDSENTRKEAAKEAVETLASTDGIMDLVRSHSKIAVSVLLADVILFLGLMLCCSPSNAGGTRGCCRCRPQSKLSGQKHSTPEVDRLVSRSIRGMQGSYGGCALHMPQSHSVQYAPGPQWSPDSAKLETHIAHQQGMSKARWPASTQGCGHYIVVKKEPAGAVAQTD